MTLVVNEGPRVILGVAAALLLSATMGCSSFDGGGDRLALDMGAVQTSTAQNQPDRWWCLGEDPITRESRRAVSGMGQVALRLPLHDQFTQEPPRTALEARLCASSDLACTRPIVDWMAVPADGRVTTLVPSGFLGYAEVRGAGYPNSLYIIDTPVLRDLDLYSHVLVAIEGLLAIGQILMQPVLQADQGLIIAAPLDCNGVAAEGVRVDISTGGDPFVLVGGVPVAGSNVSTADGTVIFNRVPPGPAVVTVTLPDGRKMREQGVYIRGGWFSETFPRPIVYSASELCGIGSDQPVPGRLESVGRIQLCQPPEGAGAGQ